ncbi:MotA/TolQ/ExbB proton channel family protein [Maribellus sediminis]|uniref:MotA/TolQ/ExbB proton channel family protein n=1 Tax=Maribellus sediminis TaxID=2696285 RepID=UPI0014309F59|nr:MotA/TolQ/ExbB proton channel family protein [Maribellus sediminis]
MSLADLLTQNFFDGGPFFMTLHYLMWVLVTIFTFRAAKIIRSANNDYKKLEKLNTTILFIGGFGLLFSLFYRTMGLYSAFSVLETTSDISPTLVAGGFKASLVATLYSLLLFLVTVIIWFIFRLKIIDQKLSA